MLYSDVFVFIDVGLEIGLLIWSLKDEEASFAIMGQSFEFSLTV